MNKNLFIIGIIAVVIFLCAFKKRNWWENVYSSEELAILDRMECSILNQLDEIEKKLDDMENKFDDILNKLDSTENKIDDIEFELALKN